MNQLDQIKQIYMQVTKDFEAKEQPWYRKFENKKQNKRRK